MSKVWKYQNNQENGIRREGSEICAPVHLPPLWLLVEGEYCVMGYRGKGFMPGDRVIVTEYPERPVGRIVRRCRTDNRFLFVNVEGRGENVRVRERSLRRVDENLDGGKAKGNAE